MGQGRGQSIKLYGVFFQILLCLLEKNTLNSTSRHFVGLASGSQDPNPALKSLYKADIMLAMQPGLNRI